MGYSVKGGKLQSRKLARSLKQSIKFTQSLPAEVQERMEAEGRELGPKELAKKLARKYLASEVSEKIMHDLPDMRATYQGDVPEDMIVELLEQLVEGDLVLDDASVHQWFKKKLDDYRDFCIKIDEDQTVEVIQARIFPRLAGPLRHPDPTRTRRQPYARDTDSQHEGAGLARGHGTVRQHRME